MLERQEKMRLVEIKIENFRCLRAVTVPVHDLTVLIGENDAGKSSVLDLLEIALNGGQPDQNDYFREGDGPFATYIETILKFDINPDSDADVQPYLSDDGKLYLQRRFESGTSQTWYKGQKFEDERLHQDFTKLKVAELDQALSELGITFQGRLNKEQKLALVDEYKNSAPTHTDWIEVSLSRIGSTLPRFERYRAIDYQAPENLINKTLKTVYESIIYEAEPEGSQRPIQTLRELRSQVEREFNNEVAKLVNFSKRYNDRVQRIQFEPNLDFSRGFAGGEFRIDDGRGPHLLSKSGDGTKRRLLLAIIDWDRQVIEEQAPRMRSIIRGYDEPDVNLHYDAQRTMYRAIRSIVTDSDSSVQAILCTHSLAMIDRAPARSINVMRLCEAGETRVEFLDTGDDPEIEDFLSEMASDLGITNSLLFYERCYVIIEGPTEQNALPRMYRRIYGHCMIEDGIRLVSIEGNGGKSGFLKLLGRNRQSMTLTLLDKDSTLGQDLEQAGFQPERLHEQVYYIGKAEFEDAFEDEVICMCLEQVWPRCDGAEWHPRHLTALRESDNRKFSVGLMSLIHRNCEEGPQAKKPIFGREIGRLCPADRIPTEIGELFDAARHIAHC